jgi:metal-responsive CopG/Arc/MetJ family transcriptional regulator
MQQLWIFPLRKDIHVYTMPCMEKRTQIGIKLQPELIRRIDAFRKRQEFPPTRTNVIERAIEEYLQRSERSLRSRK